MLWHADAAAAEPRFVGSRPTSCWLHEEVVRPVVGGDEVAHACVVSDRAHTGCVTAHPLAWRLIRGRTPAEPNRQSTAAVMPTLIQTATNPKPMTAAKYLPSKLFTRRPAHQRRRTRNPGARRKHSRATQLDADRSDALPSFGTPHRDRRMLEVIAEEHAAGTISTRKGGARACPTLFASASASRLSSSRSWRTSAPRRRRSGCAAC